MKANKAQSNQILSYLENEFKPITGVIDPFNRRYDAAPLFVEHWTGLKSDIHTNDVVINGMTVRVKTYSPMSQTKSYAILYELRKAPKLLTA
jgi:hypothetical protein